LYNSMLISILNLRSKINSNLLLLVKMQEI